MQNGRPCNILQNRADRKEGDIVENNNFEAFLGMRHGGAGVQREDMRRLLEPLLRTSRGDALKSLFVLLGSTRDIVQNRADRKEGDLVQKGRFAAPSLWEGAPSKFMQNRADRKEGDLVQKGHLLSPCKIVSSLTGGANGQRRLTYMMLDIWYDVYPVLAVYALEALIVLGHGSWRDVAGLCCYLRNESPRGQDHPFIETAVELSIRKLRGLGIGGVDDVGVALAAKWVPRETSKKKSWLFTMFAQKWFGCSNLTTEHRRQFRRWISGWSSSSSSSSVLCSSDKKTMQQVFDAVVLVV